MKSTGEARPRPPYPPPPDSSTGRALPPPARRLARRPRRPGYRTGPGCRSPRERRHPRQAVRRDVTVLDDRADGAGKPVRSRHRPLSRSRCGRRAWRRCSGRPGSARDRPARPGELARLPALSAGPAPAWDSAISRGRAAMTSIHDSSCRAAEPGARLPRTRYGWMTRATVPPTPSAASRAASRSGASTPPPAPWVSASRNAGATAWSSTTTASPWEVATVTSTALPASGVPAAALRITRR